MDAAAMLAGRPVAAAMSDASSTAVAARDAKLDPKLVAAAHSFEASLMQELLKPLNGEGSGEGNGGLFGDEDGGGGLGASADGSGGALMSFGSEALASALSQKGGLGIARRILDHFEAIGDRGAGAGAASADESAGRGVKFQDGTKIVTKVITSSADELMEGEPEQ
jgi:Rod binding domain-containing protein